MFESSENRSLNEVNIGEILENLTPEFRIDKNAVDADDNGGYTITFRNETQVVVFAQHGESSVQTYSFGSTEEISPAEVESAFKMWVFKNLEEVSVIAERLGEPFPEVETVDNNWADVSDLVMPILLEAALR